MSLRADSYQNIYIASWVQTYPPPLSYWYLVCADVQGSDSLVVCCCRGVVWGGTLVDACISESQVVNFTIVCVGSFSTCSCAPLPTIHFQAQCKQLLFGKCSESCLLCCTALQLWWSAMATKTEVPYKVWPHLDSKQGTHQVWRWCLDALWSHLTSFQWEAVCSLRGAKHTAFNLNLNLFSSILFYCKVFYTE